MAKLKDRMRKVASNLISEYGNSCILYKKVLTNSTYDPDLDEYVGTNADITVNTKCTYRELTLTEIQETNSDNISKVAVIPFSDNIAAINTEWTIDGNKIIKVTSSQIQDGAVTFTVYVG